MTTKPLKISKKGTNTDPNGSMELEFPDSKPEIYRLWEENSMDNETFYYGSLMPDMKFTTKPTVSLPSPSPSPSPVMSLASPPVLGISSSPLLKPQQPASMSSRSNGQAPPSRVLRDTKKEKELDGAIEPQSRSFVRRRSSDSADGIKFFKIEFKNQRTKYAYSNKDNDSYSAGDWVLVQADRGLDLGILGNLIVDEKQISICKQKMRSEKEVMMPMKIIRIARLDEVEKLAEKEKDEETALIKCKELIKRDRIPVILLGAEYQYDRKKLTFSFESMGGARVDFRNFLKVLFSEFRTRIWMEQVRK